MYGICCMLKDGAREVYEALESGKITDSMKTRTVKWYKYLLEVDRLTQDVVIRGTVL